MVISQSPRFRTRVRQVPLKYGNYMSDFFGKISLEKGLKNLFYLTKRRHTHTSRPIIEIECLDLTIQHVYFH